MDFQSKSGGMLYVVLETKVSFRPCLTGCNKKAEVVIPPAQDNWIMLVITHEYLLK